MRDRSASPSMGNIIAFVVIFIVAMFVYPWLANKFFPNQQAVQPPAVGDDQKKLEKPPEQKLADAKIADALKRAGPKPADEPIRSQYGGQEREARAQRPKPSRRRQSRPRRPQPRTTTAAATSRSARSSRTRTRTLFAWAPRSAARAGRLPGWNSAANVTVIWTTAAAISGISSWTTATRDPVAWSRLLSRAPRQPRPALSRATAL